MIVVDFSLKEKKMKKWNLNEAKNFVNFIKKIVKVIKKMKNLWNCNYEKLFK